MRSVAACALAALLLILAPVVNANEYSFDSSYADVVRRSRVLPLQGVGAA